MMNFRRKVLKVEIKVTIWKMKILEDRMVQIWGSLESVLTVSDFRECKATYDRRYETEFKRQKDLNIKKIKRLRVDSVSVNIPVGPVDETGIFNYTTVGLPNEVMRTLHLGPGFGIRVKKKEVPVATLIKDLEYGLQFLKIEGADQVTVREERDCFRSRVINLWSNFYNRNEKHTMDITRKEFLITKRFFRDNPDLILAKSDKGNGTVIMGKRNEIDAG